MKKIFCKYLKMNTCEPVVLGEKYSADLQNHFCSYFQYGQGGIRDDHPGFFLDGSNCVVCWKDDCQNMIPGMIKDFLERKGEK